MPKSREQLQNYASTMALSGERGIAALVPKSIQRSTPPGLHSKSADTSKSNGNNHHLGGHTPPIPGPLEPGRIPLPVKRKRCPGNYLKERLRWSDEEEATLFKLRRDGKSWQEISAILGRTPEAVQKKGGLKYPEKRTYRKDLDISTDLQDGLRFRRECDRAIVAYMEAVEAAGGGSWGGTLVRNSVGMGR